MQNITNNCQQCHRTWKLKQFTKAKLIPVVNTIDEYKRITNANINYAIHIDTGINRLGISSKDVKEIEILLENNDKSKILFFIYFWCDMAN